IGARPTPRQRKWARSQGTRAHRPSSRRDADRTQDAGGGGGHGVQTLPPPTTTTPPSAPHAAASCARLALDCVQSALALHGAPPLLQVPAATSSAGFGSLHVPSW